MTLCVYALTRATARVSGNGMSGERLRLLRQGTLGAIVGRLSKAPAGSVEDLRRYDRVIRRLATVQASLLPARFGTCFDDPHDLEFVLRSRGPALRRALAHVRGRAQMTVRLVGVPAHAQQGDTAVDVRRLARARAGSASRSRPRAHHRDAANPSADDTPGPGTAFLRSRAEAAALERHVPGFDPMQAAVRRWIRDVRIERRAGVTTVYHLIPRGAAEAYRCALDRAGQSSALRVHVTGPWPPYAFAETW